MTVDTHDHVLSEPERGRAFPGDFEKSPAGYSQDFECEKSLPGIDRPELGGALQALSGDILTKRSLEVSATSFITIMSIILGVALALLAEKTFPTPSLLVGSQAVCMLMIFIFSFYYHLSISITLRWAPSIVDCALPFVLFSLEIPPSYFLGDVSRWNSWIAVLFFSTAAGAGSTIIWSPISHFGGDRYGQKMLHRLFVELSVILVFGASLLVGVAVVAHLTRAGDLGWGLLSCAIIIAMLVTMVLRMEFRLARFYAYFGVNRPPFN
ncbi:hypothetical protein JIG36_23415 [Actinoplanes sp. LDG1-06]|uniref:Uncharacterized protein n=1 Tax=Paractinoplanes ovalisporus TaxID=2810368 RepID=A0ABS2AFA4_9ACTN|nr:hypothetical protein [Actinoplanes ovalisporus]MBM2618510.1 hypothetical protein [Actinoplanes ovalisporus]